MTATVLIVCGVSANRSEWESLLERQGYEVIIAPNGEAALSVCPQLQPDLVLVDEVLPDAQGAEICRRLKNGSRNQLTPVVLIRAAAHALDSSPSLQSGSNDVWEPASSPREAFNRVHFLHQLKMYIEEEADSVVFALARTIEARDRYAAGHGVRVSNYAVRLGQSLGLGEVDLSALKIGGLIHDIGKIGISEAILFKPGPLTVEETRSIEQHPLTGERICAPLKSLRHVLPIIRHHHERMDGSGYPDGLRGDQIPLNARILHVVDVCDALSSDRPYRKAMPLPTALLGLYEEADRGWLDRDLVSQFASLVLGMESSAGVARHAGVRPLQQRGASR